MAPRRALANISFTVDSASEDDMTHDELNVLPTPDSNTENKAPARKARGTSTQAKKAASSTKVVAKGRSVARCASGSSVLSVRKTSAAVTKQAPAKRGRKALIERNNTNSSDTEEVEEFDQEQPMAQSQPAKRGRPQKKTSEEEQPPVPTRKGRKPKVMEEEAAKEMKSKKPRGRKAAPKQEAEPEHATIPETQPDFDTDAMDVEESIEVEEIPESMPPPPRPSARRTQAQLGRTIQSLHGARRTGSVSDSERDPIMRRKVGDLTKKLEAMTARYDTLKQAASSEKESKFDQLKKRTEQTGRDQEAIIKALRLQIAESQSRTSDLASMKKELTRLAKENAHLTADNKKLTDSLATAHNENKILSNKLAAARSSTQPEQKNVPGSAVKSRTNGVVLPGTVEAAKEAQLAKQKVDLYSDFTNLVVLGMKRNEDDEDVYDCLQTGRNGTLHFHLTVAAGSESYEDTEFIYQPLLNEQRDRELLDLLPDYLTEEICFPRGQAAKFYCKVVDSMSKKIILEEE